MGQSQILSNEVFWICFLVVVFLDFQASEICEFYRDGVKLSVSFSECNIFIIWSEEK